MFFVYQLQSLPHPRERYTGFTEDLDSRLKSHNNGQSPHTAPHKPWRLVNSFAFSDETTARNFEAYLKTGSGRAFANKRLWPTHTDLDSASPQSPNSDSNLVPFQTQEAEESNTPLVPSPALKPLALSATDLEWIAFWMQSNMHSDDAFLDLETGKTHIGREEIEDEFGPDISSEDDRFFYLDSIDSHESFRYMEDFARSHSMPERTRERLFDALDRPKPFRRFKDVQHDTDMQLLSEFENYKTAQIIDTLRHDFQALGYQLIITQTPPTP